MFGFANNDILALGLGMYFGAGKYIWYKVCFSNHFSASSFVEPDALDNFRIALLPLQYPSSE